MKPNLYHFEYCKNFNFFTMSFETDFNQITLFPSVASTTVASMETVVQITIVTAILVGWVKTAPLIVAVMDTVIAHKASAFVTNAKVGCNHGGSLNII